MKGGKVELLLYLLIGLLVLGAFYRWRLDEGDSPSTAVGAIVVFGFLIVPFWPVVVLVYLGSRLAQFGVDEWIITLMVLVFLGLMALGMFPVQPLVAYVWENLGKIADGLGNFFGQPSFLGLALWVALLGAIPVLLLGSLLAILTGIILVKGGGGIAVVLRELAKRATLVNVTTLLLGFLIVALFLARVLGLAK